MSEDTPKSPYAVENGIVTREGQPVAFYKDGQITYLADGKTYAKYIRATLANAGFPVNGVAAADTEQVVLPAPVEAHPQHALNAEYPKFPGAIDPMLGDKTPAFVDWLHDNHPEAAQKRYANRIHHRV